MGNYDWQLDEPAPDRPGDWWWCPDCKHEGYGSEDCGCECCTERE